MKNMANDLLSCYVESPNNNLLKKVVSKYYSFVYSTCYRVLERSDLADDATQATFLILFKKASSLNPTEKLISWLHRTAYLSALWLRRQEKQRMKREQKKPFPKESFSPEETFDKKDLKACIDLALNQMPEKYRTLILLKFYEDKSYQEISLILKISEEAVRKKVQRGLLKLESLLKANKVQVSLDILLAFLGHRMIEATPSANLANLLSGCDNLGSISEWNRPAFEIFKGVEKMLFWTKIKSIFVFLSFICLISVFGFVYLRGEDAPIQPDTSNPTSSSSKLIIEYEYEVFIAGKKVGIWKYQVQETKEHTVILETMIVENVDRYKKIQMESKLYFKINQFQSPIKLEAETSIDGIKCFSGFVEISENNIKGQYTKYMNKDSGVKITPPQIQDISKTFNKEAQLIFISSLPFIAPFLKDKKAEIKNVILLYYPKDLDELIDPGLSYFIFEINNLKGGDNYSIGISEEGKSKKNNCLFNFDKNNKLLEEFQRGPLLMKKATK